MSFDINVNNELININNSINEIQVNSADQIHIDVDINLIKLKIVNNKNLEIKFPTGELILFIDLVFNLFNNEFIEEHKTKISFLLNVDNTKTIYTIDAMQLLFDAVEFTSSNLNKTNNNLVNNEHTEQDVMYDEEEFLKNQYKNTEKNDLIFYDELVKNNK